MSVREKLTPTGQKKLLALDGGGIRGMITVETLAEIERLLREKLQDDGLVLADYFDYVAGTSTGAIIATCVAWGMSTSEIRDFYEKNGAAMFDRVGWLERIRTKGSFKYDDEPLAQKLKDVLSDNRQPATLGSDKLRTLLMVILRNATTDSPWPLSNNPMAKYNDRERKDCNLDLPLWKIVRASTAAPVFFPPEIVELGEGEQKKEFIFVDGGVTPYNNPAFILFLMATVKAYRLEWPTGEDRMLLVSVGTGLNPGADPGLRASEMNLLYNAANLPSALMFAANNEQDMLCRIFGRCLQGGQIDREIDRLMGEDGILLGAGGQALPKHFTYVRYNAELTREGLEKLGLPDIDPRDVQAMDSVKHIGTLQKIGEAVGEQQVNAEHFNGFLA